MNKFIGIGYLGGDPEPITRGCKLSLATEVWAGDRTKTTWIRVLVFGQSAQNCLDHKHKGDRVLVEGRVDVSATGTTVIVTDDVTFL